VKRTLTCRNQHRFNSAAKPGNTVRCPECGIATYVRKTGQYRTVHEYPKPVSRQIPAQPAVWEPALHASREPSGPESLATSQSITRQQGTPEQQRIRLFWRQLLQRAKHDMNVRNTLHVLTRMAAQEGITERQLPGYTYLMFQAWGMQARDTGSRRIPRKPKRR
jgi:hypothetical protein